MGRHGGGWQAIAYTLKKGRQVGFVRLWRAMRARNACKTCALGMGGQRGGMVNEAGHFPEVCKKSLQAMTADMQGRIEPRFFETVSLAGMQELTPRELEHCGRLVHPMIAREGDTHYRPIEWDEAIAYVVDRMRDTSPERAFFYASGRSSNEAGFLLQLLARSYGTNHLSNCSYYCHQASGVGLAGSIGTGTATVTLDDLETCDLVFLIGGNPSSNHPRLMASLARLRERGGNVVVVNPLREVGLVEFRVPSNVKSMLFGSKIASHYAQIAIGGDIALMIGLGKALIAIPDAVDGAYLDAHVDGFAELEDLVGSIEWSAIESASGVPRDQIEEIASVYAASKAAIFAWTMGITHHEHGVENVEWIANLALMRGMVGRPGSGLMPIRGHSNVQGLGSIGVYPGIRAEALAKLEALGVRPPSWKGLDTMGAMESAHAGLMEFALCLGGNLYGANPDAAFSKQALANLDTIVYMSTTLNTGHAHGLAKTTLILPVAARDEDSQATTQESMFSFVRLSDGGPARHPELKTEVEVLAAIGERIAADRPSMLDWARLRNHDAIRRLIAELVPELEQIATIGETKREFHIPGRSFRKPEFKTRSGRATLHAHPIPSLPALGPEQLRLMTIRSEGQFNTVVYDDEDLYRGVDRRDAILMSPPDVDRLSLLEGERVEVVSHSGTMRAVVHRFDIAVGCAAMYYPEANVLTSKQVDPRSKTPAFKSVVVSVRKLT